jgi:hypothetical protein
MRCLESLALIPPFRWANALARGWHLGGAIRVCEMVNHPGAGDCWRGDRASGHSVFFGLWGLSIEVTVDQPKPDVRVDEDGPKEV